MGQARSAPAAAARAPITRSGWTARARGRRRRRAGANPGRNYLPRKFKCGIAIPPSNDIDVFSQDLGFIAISRRGRLAASMLHGRWAGCHPRRGRDLSATGRPDRFRNRRAAADGGRSGRDHAARFRRPQQSQACAPQIHDRTHGGRGSCRRWNGAPAGRWRRRGRSSSPAAAIGSAGAPAPTAATTSPCSSRAGASPTTANYRLMDALRALARGASRASTGSRRTRTSRSPT